MNEIRGVVANLKREQKVLKKRLRTIGKALRAFKGLNGLVAPTTHHKGQKHSAKSRKAIGAAKRKWWKQRRALLKSKSKSS
jgi:hypothetical protein